MNQSNTVRVDDEVHALPTLSPHRKSDGNYLDAIFNGHKPSLNTESNAISQCTTVTVEHLPTQEEMLKKLQLSSQPTFTSLYSDKIKKIRR